ncbi:bacitracin transport system permease protein [Bacillus fengqiuensis]|nr:bacitracin transport system permease protein [Bacillus fengqiuensis]
MVNLLYTELLKLKRSSMFFISLLGAIVSPVMVVMATYIHQPSTPFTELFHDTNLYTVGIIGVPLYAVVAAYLFNREYVEDTLKNLLTIPVSRLSFITSKLLLLLIWIMLLTFIAWVLTLLLGVLLHFEGLNAPLVLKSFTQFLIGGGFLFILSSPVILITLILKNYVPPIIFAIVVTLLNVMSGNSEDRGLFPWMAAVDIANDTLLPTYPPEFSYIAIAAVSLTGFTAAIAYFQKTDIH